MGLRANIAANYIGAAIVALAPIVVLPLYLRALGPGYWGLAGFVAVLQSLLGLIDAGLSQAMLREFSIRVSAGDRPAAARLLRALERAYWLVAFCLAIPIAAASPWIARHWLELGDLPQSAGELAVLGAAALFFCQFPTSPYRSVLIGGQYQVTFNVANIVMAFVRHGIGAAIVVATGSFAAYIAWSIVSGASETLLRRQLAWRRLGASPAAVGWDVEELKRVAAFAGTMSLAVLVGAANTQVDKVVVSARLPVEQLGYYTIAWNLAAGMLQLVYPLIHAVLPRMVALRDRPAELWRLNVAAIGAIGAGVVAAGLAFFGFGMPALAWWLGSVPVAASVYPPLALLLLGTALNALYNVGYTRWIACGYANKILLVNALGFSLSLALLPYFVERYGLAGASFSWIAVNALGLALSLEWLWKRQ